MGMHFLFVISSPIVMEVMAQVVLAHLRDLWDKLAVEMFILARL